MAGSPESAMAFEVGKQVCVELVDGTVLRGFVHAEDRAARLVCLELVPTAQVAIIAIKSVKTVSRLADPGAKRKWPAKRAFHKEFKDWECQWDFGMRCDANFVVFFCLAVCLCQFVAVVDVTRLQPEQEIAFRKREAEFDNIGVGVSANAQAIFDVLAKTLPCKWEKDVIVVLDTVRLAPPYTVKSIR